MFLFSHLIADSEPFNPEDIIEKLIPNIWDFLINLAAFVVLLLVVFFVAYKPVKKFIKKRQDYIEGNIKESEESKKKAKDREIESEGYVDEAKKKASSIIVDAKKQADVEANNIIEEAKKESKRLYEENEAAIKQAKEASKKEIHDEIVQVAIEASSHILEREINSKDEEKLLDDFVNQIEDSKDGK